MWCSSSDDRQKVDDEGEDYSLYVTLMLPGGQLMHEQDETCWCDPEIVEYSDGEVEIIHSCLQ